VVESFSPYSAEVSADESHLPVQVVHYSAAIETALDYALSNDIGVWSKSVEFSSARNIYRVNFDDGSNFSLGAIGVYVGAGSQEVLGVSLPSAGGAGDFLSALRLPLHSGSIGGEFGPFVIAFTGLMTALLAIFGVSMWLRKRIA
jgi:hypothetical protein